MELPEELEIIIEGWNGSLFHVAGGELQGAEGVGLGMGDVGTAFEDMYESPFDTIYNSTAFEIGGRFGGVRENMFEFALAFHIRPTNGAHWRMVESRFRKSLHHSKDAKIRVKIPGVSERWLNVRLREHTRLNVSVDPNKQRYGLLICHFIGPYPRWMEDDVVSEYVTETDTTASGEEIGSVMISNPTSDEIWLKWVAQAGNEGVTWTLPDFSFGDDRFDREVEDADRMIEMPELILGEHIVVDTDELTMLGQVNSSLDTSVYLRMNSMEFLYPVPAYTEPIEVPVTAQKADIGNGIQVRCPRPWIRPWGMD